LGGGPWAHRPAAEQQGRAKRIDRRACGRIASGNFDRPHFFIRNSSGTRIGRLSRQAFRPATHDECPDSNETRTVHRAIVSCNRLQFRVGANQLQISVQREPNRVQFRDALEAVPRQRRVDSRPSATFPRREDTPNGPAEQRPARGEKIKKSIPHPFPCHQLGLTRSSGTTIVAKTDAKSKVVREFAAPCLVSKKPDQISDKGR